MLNVNAVHTGKFARFFTLLILMQALFISGCEGSISNISHNDENKPNTMAQDKPKLKTDIKATDIISNNTQGSCVVKINDMIYFSSAYVRDNIIYKINAQGAQQKAFDLEASEFTVADNLIFPSTSYIDTQTYSIYRMDRNGKDQSQIFTSDRQFFVVHNDGQWIYYLTSDCLVDSSAEKQIGEEPPMYEFRKLYRVKTDGSGYTELLLNYIADTADQVYISDGWIYYVCQPGDWAKTFSELKGLEKGMYRVRVDGTQKTRLSSEVPFTNLVKQGDWLFFGQNGLYKMKIDGAQKSKITDGDIARVNVQGDYIYYSDFNDNISLYKIGIDGQNKQKLSQQNHVQDIAVVGEWVYFDVSDVGNASMYRIKTDGSNEQLLLSKTFAKKQNSN